MTSLPISDFEEFVNFTGNFVHVTPPKLIIREKLSFQALKMNDDLNNILM